jgi:hypothetical protein
MALTGKTIGQLTKYTSSLTGNELFPLEYNGATYHISQSQFSASYAVTASYVLNAVSSSFATTASYASNGGTNIYTADGTLSAARTLTLNSQPLTIAGTASSRFFANGNVGIGTTTDSGQKFQCDGTANFRGVGNNVGVFFDNGIKIGSYIELGQYTFSPYMNINVSGTNTEWGTTAFGVNNLITGHPNIRITGGSSGKTFSYVSEIGGSPWATYRYFYDDGSIVMQYGATAITQITSSLLTLNSTTQGFLPPRMTTTQKNAIGTPAQGLMVFDTTLVKLCVYNGTAWETITSI